MVIITSYVAGERYGMLGPEMAATIIQRNTEYECRVIACTRLDSKDLLKKAVADFIGDARPVIAFSTLSGREDLFFLAKEFTMAGAFTILAGPQANVDYVGEKEWSHCAHRFPGLRDHFSCALHGPGEQAIALLNNLDTQKLRDVPGSLFCREDGSVSINSKQAWDKEHLNHVNWDTMYRLEGSALVPVSVDLGQVVQHIGCPHASREQRIQIPYPAALGGEKKGSLAVPVMGCSFCDVAVDKGYTLALDMDTVLGQLSCLPAIEDGSKISFELVNENPLPGLSRLLESAQQEKIRLTQVNLTMRADWFVAGAEHLRHALRLAEQMNVRILLSSMGFESFDDTILANLHKGLSVGKNLEAIRLMRDLKKHFPRTWGYSRQDGAVHGFIHPTPWDTSKTEANNQKYIGLYSLAVDILPDHSIPLIIHHASPLGDWIRTIEEREGMWFRRYVSTIGWWDMHSGCGKVVH